MTMTLDAPKTTLDAADIATIVKVAKMTTEVMDRDGRKTPTNPIFCIRGPEVAEALAKALPDLAEQIRIDFPRLQRLGTSRIVGETSANADVKGGSVRIFKRIEMMFRGSPQFPNGIPVGVYERATQAIAGVSNKFSETGSYCELVDEDIKRLNSLAYNKRYLTPEQIAADEERKKDARNERVETDLDPIRASAKILGPAIGEGVAMALAANQPMDPEAMIRALKAAGYNVTAPAAPEKTAK